MKQGEKVQVGQVIAILNSGATNLPLLMSVSRALLVFLLTILMCSISGAIAMRKIGAADPAEIF